MSQMFYAVLAGERGKKASANARVANENYDAAVAWEQNAKEWQNSATQWKEHSLALRSRIVEWQQSAIESEAISRAKTEIIESNTGKRISEVAGINDAEADRIIEAKRQEVIKEWGVNPWGNDPKSK